MRSKRADSDKDGTRFRLGVEQFNRREFWNAHESWEAIWLASDGERRQFLQGLIQLAAVCYHLENENERGAERLLDLARAKLRPLPGRYGGIALDELIEQADRLVADRRVDNAFPLIRFSGP